MEISWGYQTPRPAKGTTCIIGIVARSKGDDGIKRIK